MNYLQLTQRLAREVGVAGLGPISVVGQTGEAGRLVNWVQDAWNDIQTAHQDWLWLRASTSFVTVAGQASYTTAQANITAGTFGMWDRDTFRVYLTSAGLPAEQFLTYMSYDDWRDLYQFGTQRDVRTQPDRMTITPNQSIGLGPTPPVGYTITGDYYKAPVVLAANIDIPAMPTQFHMAIVWKAAMAYGAYTAAQEVYQRGQIEFGKLFSRLEIDQLPEFETAGTLE